VSGLRWSALLVCFVVSCDTAVKQGGQPGHLDVQWTGSNPGKISGVATAAWCAPRRLLEIRAIQGDTGIGLAIYPVETIAAASYRVLDPAKAESLPPAAGVALRWLTQTSVQGFQADSGTVKLKRSASGLLSGTLSAHARSVADTQRIAVSGRFKDLVVRPATQACAASPAERNARAAPGDTGVH
jgi:hypothetical protein